MKYRAFTLVELLVVVAIISILATISLPNFQHAMTKSRVAAAQKEMQTLSTAIEAYALDYNVYPLDGNDWFDKKEEYYDQLHIQSVLTTPTTFISEIPDDLFHQKHMHKDDLMAERHFQFGPPYPYIYMSKGNFTTHRGAPKAYYIFSVGPNHYFDNASEKEEDFVLYDATNGTISGGDLMRKGP
jgi:general secretion pathway protein G